MDWKQQLRAAPLRALQPARPNRSHPPERSKAVPSRLETRLRNRPVVSAGIKGSPWFAYTSSHVLLRTNSNSEENTHYSVTSSSIRRVICVALSGALRPTEIEAHGPNS